jgi:hypothetical protein
MNRNEKLGKLGRAVREFRGVIITETGKWLHPPKLKAAVRVERWLKELGIDVEDGMAKINAFQILNEFRACMRGL